MPAIDLSILNQRQTPAFYADVFANRPAAGFVGRIFVSTDTYAFYRDNGTGWDLIGGPGTGTITGAGASGQIALWSGASTIVGDTGLTYDGTANSLTASQFIVTGGTSSQFLKGDGSLDSSAYITASALSGYVPYTGATTNVNLGSNDITAASFTGGTGSFATSGSGNAVGINQSSGAGIALNINKSGSGEGLFVTKGSGGGNASKIVGGKSVFENSASDSHIQIVGATAPSLRIDNLETGATNRIGIGLSTAVNNFIQGSTGGEYCIFNSSTTASPILFGIYDAGLTNTQEAARISPARNFLIGTTTDAGYKLAVNGTINAVGTISSQPTSNANGLVVVNGSSGSYGGNVTFQRGGTQDGVIGTQAANNTIITGATNADICILADGGGRSIRLSTTNTNPQFNLTNNGNVLLNTTVNASGGPTFYIKNLNGPVANIAGFNFCGTSTADTANNNLLLSGAYYNGSNIIATQPEAVSYQQYNGNHNFYTGTGLTPGNTGVLTERFIIGSNGNILIGTTTDSGEKLQVNGQSRLSGRVLLNSSVNNDYLAFNHSGVQTWYQKIVNTNNSSFIISSDYLGGTNYLTITEAGVSTFSGSVNIGNSVAAAVGVASTHKVSILINGVQYYLLASNV